MPKKNAGSQKKNKASSATTPSTHTDVSKTETLVKPGPPTQVPTNIEPKATESYGFSHLKKETEEITQLNKTFNNREIRSNWSKYETELLHFEDAEEPKTSNFNFLINSASSDCSHFQFNSEKNWEKKNISKPVESKIFNLNLQVLSAGLACVPFYERVGLDKSVMSEVDLEKCDYFALKSKEKYIPVKDKFINGLQTQLKKHQTEYKQLQPENKNLQGVKIVDLIQKDISGQLEPVKAVIASPNESVQDQIKIPAFQMNLPTNQVIQPDIKDLSTVSSEVPPLPPREKRVRKCKQSSEEEANLPLEEVPEMIVGDYVPEETGIAFQSAIDMKEKEEEDLEDWLDSVLDD